VVPHPLSFCPFSFGFSSSFVHFIIVEVFGFGFHVWVSCPSHSQSSMINISAFACHISMNIGVGFGTLAGRELNQDSFEVHEPGPKTKSKTSTSKQKNLE